MWLYWIILYTQVCPTIPPIVFEDMTFCPPQRLYWIAPWAYIKNWPIYFKIRLLQKHNIKNWSCIDTECQSVLLLPHDVSYTRRFPLQKQKKSCWSAWCRCGRSMVIMSARVQLRQRQSRDDTISKNCRNSNVPLPRQWYKRFPCLQKRKIRKVSNYSVIVELKPIKILLRTYHSEAYPWQF